MPVVILSLCTGRPISKQVEHFGHFSAFSTKSTLLVIADKQALGDIRGRMWCGDKLRMPNFFSNILFYYLLNIYNFFMFSFKAIKKLLSIY